MLKTQPIFTDDSLEILDSLQEMLTSKVDLASDEVCDSALSAEFAQARDQRSRAESRGTGVAREVLQEAERIYRRLIASGERTLQAAQQLEALVQSRLREAQEALAQAHTAEAAAQAQREQLREEAAALTEEIVAAAYANAEQQAQSIIEAATQAAQQTQEEVDSLRAQAQQELQLTRTARADADAQCQLLFADAVHQAQEIIACSYQMYEEPLGQPSAQSAVTLEQDLISCQVARLWETSNHSMGEVNHLMEPVESAGTEGLSHLPSREEMDPQSRGVIEKELVLGVTTETTPKAYPFSLMSAGTPNLLELGFH